MLESGLVSIITPCYNVTPYLSHYFDSLLQQTYKKLEIILVNDGSTDATHEAITSWLPKLEAAGYQVKYLVKENGGLASAINFALPVFTGEFLIWTDPDDCLYPESIEKRVDFLVRHPEFGLVRSDADICHEDDRSRIVGTIRPGATEAADGYLFTDLVFQRTFLTCICYMVRSSCFLEANPARSIYVRKDAGQNWQMLLPVTKMFRCGYLPESLCCYLFRRDSHSHSVVSLEKKLIYLDMCLDVISHTLQSMDYRDQVLENELAVHYAVKRCRLGLEFKDRDLIYQELKYLYRRGKLTFLQQVIMVLSSMRITFKAMLVPILWLNRHPIYIVEKLI